MKTLFENEDFILKSTGHDFDFVGIIETKTDEPLTFFFSEELVPYEKSIDKSEGFSEEEYDELGWNEKIDEDETKLIDVYYGLQTYDYDSDDALQDGDEEQDVAQDLCADSYFRTRDDKYTGFLSDPRQRGQFLAIIKAYCPEQLKEIAWA